MRALCTGQPFTEPFKEGWAKLPFQGNAGHYWSQAPHVTGFKPAKGCAVLRSACGKLGGTDPRTPALPLGNWPACKHCRKKHPGPTDAERRL